MPFMSPCCLTVPSILLAKHLDKQLGGHRLLHCHGMDEVTSQVDTNGQDLEDPAKHQNFLNERSLNLELLSVDISYWESFLSRSRHVDQRGHRQTRKTLNNNREEIFISFKIRFILCMY